MTTQPETAKPKPRRQYTRWWWIGGSTIGLLLLACLWWSARWPAYDESLVHPKLRGLTHPFQAFRVGFITDGGTIVMKGKDRAGREFKVVLPNKMSQNQGYNLIAVGGTYSETFSGAVPQEPLDDHTRRMLARFIRDYEKLDPIYIEMKDTDAMPWQYRWDCPLGQDLLRNRFPLRLPN